MKVFNRILPVLMAVVMVISGLTFAAPVYADEGSGVPNKQYSLTDISGNTVSTANTGHKLKILIFGRVGCGYTRNTLKSISGSTWVSDPDIEVMFIEEGYASDDELKEFIDEYCCSYMTICPAGDGYGRDIMWAYYRYYYGGSYISFPLIFYIDGNDNIMDMTTGYQSASNIIRRSAKFCDFGEGVDYGQDPEVMTITGICGQTEARSMLEEINARRTGSNGVTPWCYDENNNKVEYSGLGALIYDYELEKAAMQRAAELALSYNHERPSGDACYTAIEFRDDETLCAENIAVGFGTADSVLEAWWEEDELYEGQGHRRNLLNSSLNYIGIGHVRVGGVDFWAQEFTSNGSNASYTEPNDSETPFNITFYRADLQSNYMHSYEDSITILPGDTAELPYFYETVMHNNTNYFLSTYVDNKSEWVIADTSVAEISGDRIIGKAIGTTILSRAATYGGPPLEITINVVNEIPADTYDSDDQENDYQLPDDWEFDESQRDDPAHQHTFTKWTEMMPATETAAGEQGRICVVCGYEEWQEIPQLAPSLKAVKILAPKAAKKSATIRWKKVSKKNRSKIKKIQIQYSRDKNFKTGVITKYAKSSKTSYKIKGLKSKKKYYVRIRAYTKSGGKVHVSNWSSRKSFKAK